MEFSDLSLQKKEKLFKIMQDAFDSKVDSYTIAGDEYSALMSFICRARLVNVYARYNIEKEFFNLNYVRVILVCIAGSTSEQELNTVANRVLYILGVEDVDTLSLQVKQSLFMSHVHEKIVPVIKKLFKDSASHEDETSFFKQLKARLYYLAFKKAKKIDNMLSEEELELLKVKQEKAKQLKTMLSFFMKLDKKNISIDIDRLQCLLQVVKYNPTKYNSQTSKRNCVSEHIAHSLAYAEFIDKQLVPIYDIDGELILCKARIIKHYPGLVCYALIPHEYNTDKTPCVQILFRGTDYYNIIGSLQRDFESVSPGSITFSKYETAILQKIAIILKESKRIYGVLEYKLWLSGHSLGGALAQNCTISLLRLKAVKKFLLDEGKLKENTGFKDKIALRNYLLKQYTEQIKLLLGKHREVEGIITSSLAKLKQDLTKLDMVDIDFNDLHITSFNSAGVPSKQAMRSIGLAALLAEGDFKIGHDDVKVQGDRVQRTGNSHVFYDIPSNLAKVSCTFFDLGIKKSFYEIHTSYLYCKESMPAHIVISNEFSLKDVLRKELINKYMFMQIIPMMFVRPVVNLLGLIKVFIDLIFERVQYSQILFTSNKPNISKVNNIPIIYNDKQIYVEQQNTLNTVLIAKNTLKSDLQNGSSKQ